MRLFVAIDLDERLRRAVADAAARIRRNFEQAAPDARVSWTAADLLHVTVFFLGDVAETSAAVLAREFARPLPAESFELEIGAPGMFPPHGRPRVFWLGASAKDDALAGVHRAAGERLAENGVALDTAPFTPHLTIGRLRSPVRTAAAAAAFASVPRRVGACRVETVTLYESRLGRPASHIALASATLAGSRT